MFKVLYLNPTIDQTFYFDSFTEGGTNRPVSTTEEGAGKPLNFACLMSLLGGNVSLKGFRFTDDDDLIISKAEQFNLDHELINTTGKTRRNIKIVDLSKNLVTEINGNSEASDIELEELVEKIIFNGLDEKDLVVMSGSLCKGLSSDLYKKIAVKLDEMKIRFFIDASGTTLRDCLLYKPFMIKPNQDEFNQLTGITTDDILVISAENQKLLNAGLKNICVSLGSSGAVFTNDSGSYFAKPPLLRIKTTVGAGDAMAAGLLFSLESGFDTKNSLAFATACSCALITDSLNINSIQKYEKEIEVMKIV
ncbi:MAG: bifunctional hydroxymethylpyrimidine kinase/phosphomethylpyrimidine kinase [Clostridia bacterium]|nr:bifunctional hydroxymethylpyrimidine kinase/phosphomethylpyrimidine kinase [Clostridia bacterium]